MPSEDIFGVRRGLCVRAALALGERFKAAKAARAHRPRRTPKTPRWIVSVDQHNFGHYPEAIRLQLWGFPFTILSLIVASKADRGSVCRVEELNGSPNK